MFTGMGEKHKDWNYGDNNCVANGKEKFTVTNFISNNAKEWQDKTMDMHQVLLKLVDSPVAHYQEFLALAKHIKDHNLTLDFQVVHYDFGNFESLPNSITDEQIRGEVQTVLNNLRTHQDRRYQPMPAPLAAAIAPGALPHGAAHLAAVHHAHDRSCTAKILLPFQLCYNAVSTLVYNIAHALHIV